MLPKSMPILPQVPVKQKLKTLSHAGTKALYLPAPDHASSIRLSDRHPTATDFSARASSQVPLLPRETQPLSEEQATSQGLGVLLKVITTHSRLHPPRWPRAGWGPQLRVLCMINV